MTGEHYRYIANHFGLVFGQYWCTNNPRIFQVSTNDLLIKSCPESRVPMVWDAKTRFILFKATTYSMAVDILQYIKDTEVLFV